MGVRVHGDGDTVLCHPIQVRADVVVVAGRVANRKRQNVIGGDHVHFDPDTHVAIHPGQVARKHGHGRVAASREAGRAKKRHSVGTKVTDDRGRRPIFRDQPVTDGVRAQGILERGALIVDQVERIVDRRARTTAVKDDGGEHERVAVTIFIHRGIGLRGVGIDRGIRVVAVVGVVGVVRRLCARHDRVERVAVRVAVGIREVLEKSSGAVVDRAVAVVVEPVARLNATREGEIALVITVVVVRDVVRAGARTRHGRCTGAVRVAVTIEVVGARGKPLVCRGIAVLIDPVAHFRGAGLDRAVRIVAVEGVVRLSRIGAIEVRARNGQARPEGVAIGIAVAEFRSIAVVVEPVSHDFTRRRLHRGKRIVAVFVVRDVANRRFAPEHRDARVAERVAVGIDVEGGVAILHVRIVVIHVPITIVIEAVAQLVGARVHVDVAIVTIPRNVHVVRPRARTRVRCRTRAVPVTVIVEIPVREDHGTVVDHAVAIVINTVADLGGAGVALRTIVRTVRGVRHVPVTLETLQAHDGRVAVRIPICIPEERREVGGVVVGRAVAVVVEPVADVIRDRIHVFVGVVTVVRIDRMPERQRTRQYELVRSVPVTVIVHVERLEVEGFLIHQGITVVVDPITVLVRARGDREIAIVTVVARRNAVAVVVVTADVAVAVVVNTGEAVLGSARVGEAVDVVAVARKRHVIRRHLARRDRHELVAEPVTVRVFVPGDRIDRVVIRQAGAVVVDPIAVLVGVRVHIFVLVVAVVASREAVAVVVDRVDDDVLAVAVFVHSVVRGVRRVRVDGALGVVAVVRVRHEPGSVATRGVADLGISEAVVVLVRIVLDRLVRGSRITVVVEPVVTHFSVTGVDGAVRIVAVVFGDHAVVVCVVEVNIPLGLDDRESRRPAPRQNTNHGDDEEEVPVHENLGLQGE